MTAGYAGQEGTVSTVIITVRGSCWLGRCIYSLDCLISVVSMLYVGFSCLRV